MQDISEMLITIMKTLHCSCLTALIILEGDENVSDTLRIPKPLSESSISAHDDTADN